MSLPPQALFQFYNLFNNVSSGKSLTFMLIMPFTEETDATAFFVSSCRKAFKKNACFKIFITNAIGGSYEKKWKIFVHFRIRGRRTS
jgi:hypothetical protein